jgi:hypothetical protein
MQAASDKALTKASDFGLVKPAENHVVCPHIRRRDEILFTPKQMFLVGWRERKARRLV